MSPFPGFMVHKPAAATAPAAPDPEAHAEPSQSAITAASNAFVAAHLDDAVSVGSCLAGLVDKPDEFLAAIEGGFSRLCDPVVVDGQHRIAPGLGDSMGVRLPLMDAAYKAFKRDTKGISAGPLLDVVERQIDHRYMEIRWFGMLDMERLVAADADRTWNLMRRAASQASDWITVDTLAHPYATGILREPRRWSDLQAFTHAPSRWERRLVGSTIATLPHVKHAGSRDKGVASRGLMLIGLLMGDPEPDVQKALSWALRSLAAIDLAAVITFLDVETATARKTGDGERAWVIRDTLAKLPDENAAAFRAQLDGIRRRPAGQGAARSSNSDAAPRSVHHTREG